MRVLDLNIAEPADSRRRTAAVEVKNVTCSFSSAIKGGGNSSLYTAIKEVNLNIADGEFVSVVGPTGCGKSTILNVVAGLLRPSTGQINIFGEKLEGLNQKAGYLFQAEALMPWRTAFGNIAAGLVFRDLDRDDIDNRVRNWLKRVGLAGFDDRYPHQLSGGMRKRVALAQTLILDPKIILMDEPFSALDIQTRQLMENELLDIWSADKKSVLFITHDLEEAISMSDRVVVLCAGPGTHPIGEFFIDLPRPRDVAEIRHTQKFTELHRVIWNVMKEEVMKGYEQSQRK